MSPFKKPYDRAIAHVRETGILGKIQSSYATAPPPTAAKTGNIVLSLEHYEAPFYLFIILLILDSIILLVEIVREKIVARKASHAWKPTF